ncbi:MAG: hypothetical protein Q4P13_10390 [Psychrobacter sp.]|nr:hypothetical protein [Psychrobacter sp.]
MPISTRTVSTPMRANGINMSKSNTRPMANANKSTFKTKSHNDSILPTVTTMALLGNSHANAAVSNPILVNNERKAPSSKTVVSKKHYPEPDTYHHVGGFEIFFGLVFFLLFVVLTFSMFLDK